MASAPGPRPRCLLTFLIRICALRAGENFRFCGWWGLCPGVCRVRCGAAYKCWVWAPARGGAVAKMELGFLALWPPSLLFLCAALSPVENFFCSGKLAFVGTTLYCFYVQRPKSPFAFLLTKKEMLKEILSAEVQRLALNFGSSAHFVCRIFWGG